MSSWVTAMLRIGASASHAMGAPISVFDVGGIVLFDFSLARLQGFAGDSWHLDRSSINGDFINHIKLADRSGFRISEHISILDILPTLHLRVMRWNVRS